ncbi:uncharacterized protein LOC133191114 [Saccostrea echinata]|uniref:uncharacterized protein LOC133191114 n=1 Tax=Saccostrea echinata TaxID=191078 RepID=UPI002A809450|nr:uncharacterized protein LOC133191114 [Saccostrea echinata]
MAPLNMNRFVMFLLFGILCTVIADDVPCRKLGGTCQENILSCNGQYQRALCDGRTTRQCCLSSPESCSSLAKMIACKIKATQKIKLLTINPSGVDDGADAYHNIQDACNGKPSKRSNYTCSEGKSPGGVVCLKPSILRYIYDLGASTKYNFQVNAIAGACHSTTSKHYLGEAVDLELDKGSTRKAQEKSFMDACEAYGGWSHGGTHVHCQIVSP